MDDLISRQAAIAAFKPYALYDSNRTNAEWVRRIEEVLKELPSAVKHGKWVYIGGHGFQYRCTKCVRRAEYKTIYCPNCGSIMDGE